MTLRAEGPHGRLYDKDGSCFLIDRAQLADVEQAWMAGRAFWSGPDLYGQRLTLKLGSIVAVLDRTAAAIEVFEEEEEEERLRALVDGTSE
jgi:hypothetical protein